MAMAGIEEIEMQKRRQQLDKDVEHLVDKFLKVMEWEVPDIDEPKALRLVIDEIKQAIGRIESRS
jgi:hypothetical protein